MIFRSLEAGLTGFAALRTGAAFAFGFALMTALAATLRAAGLEGFLPEDALGFLLMCAGCV